jgi:hypothetical protein
MCYAAFLACKNPGDPYGYSFASSRETNMRNLIIKSPIGTKNHVT